LQHYYPGHPPLTTLEQLFALLPPPMFWSDALA
jgi:hypothetical protein